MKKLDAEHPVRMGSIKAAPHLRLYNREDLMSLTRLRRFETKLGERLQVVMDADDIERSIQSSSAKFILFGIPEDIGAKGNYGIGGADTLWIPFLQSFLNIQSNDFFDGQEVLVLGHFDFGDIQYLIDTTAKGEEEKIEAYRHAVNVIDEEVEHIAKLITRLKKQLLSSYQRSGERVA